MSARALTLLAGSSLGYYAGKWADFMKEATVERFIVEYE